MCFLFTHCSSSDAHATNTKLSSLSHRCVAKRQCFAPAALYRPFGAQAAGVRSLSQFQALQDGEKELVGLRELGLTDREIQLWQSRDTPEKVETDILLLSPDVNQART